MIIVTKNNLSLNYLVIIAGWIEFLDTIPSGFKKTFIVNKGLL